MIAAPEKFYRLQERTMQQFAAINELTVRRVAAIHKARAAVRERDALQRDADLEHRAKPAADTQKALDRANEEVRRAQAEADRLTAEYNTATERQQRELAIVEACRKLLTERGADL
jgi:hypothetical protein